MARIKIKKKFWSIEKVLCKNEFISSYFHPEPFCHYFPASVECFSQTFWSFRKRFRLEGKSLTFLFFLLLLLGSRWLSLYCSRNIAFHFFHSVTIFRRREENKKFIHLYSNIVGWVILICSNQKWLHRNKELLTLVRCVAVRHRKAANSFCLRANIYNAL